MGTFTTLDGQSPVDGSVAQPVAAGRYGMLDPIRQQVAEVKTANPPVPWPDHLPS